MTREQWEERLPAIQAWTEGKNVQFKNLEGKWVRHTSDNPAFWCESTEWRVEPVPAERWVVGLPSGTYGFTAFGDKKSCLAEIKSFYPTSGAIPVRFVEVVE